MARPRTGFDPLVTLRIPTELLERLEHEALAAGLDRSKLVRRYIAEGLARAPVRSTTSKRRPRGTAIIDPPWPYNRASRHERLTGYANYQTMAVADLERLPIGTLASYIFVWTTGPFIREAYDLVRAWGFEPITMLAGVKTDKVTPGRVPKFKPSYGVGYWFRGCVEPIILAKRKGAPSIRTQWLGLLSPNGEHSRKPDNLHELIEKSFPTPYFDVFGRRARRGWRVLGNEAP
jgi:N6-adenosine-specific RNA methylase IME4